MGGVSSRVITDDIQIVTAKATTGDFQFYAPSEHTFASSPPIRSVIPTSLDGGRIEEIEWHPNSVGFLPAGMQEDGTILEEGTATWVRISDRFIRSASVETVDVSKINLRALLGLHDPVVGSLITALGEIAKNGNQQAWPMLVESIGTALAVRLLEHMDAIPNAGEPYPEGLSKERLTRVVDYIEENISRPMRLIELAAVAALSPYHFARSFQKVMKIAPVRYVWNRRVDRAKRQLANSEIPIAVIAYDCGFSSQSHFTTLFKSLMGMTPTKYRAKLLL